jgi:ectoine hydroxylase-related dioxygenase (phytanoyl-CoA dioxygenase family)
VSIADTVTCGPLDVFERDGYVLLPRALPPALLERLTAACDRVHAEEGAGDLHLLGFLNCDPAFAELVDLPATLPVVCGALGWNIYVYHSHMDINPPRAPATPRWRWHQDGLRQNLELGAEPRPRLSVKVAVFLTDLTAPGRGNMLELPGSHRADTLARPAPGERFEHPPGACPILAAPGTAMVFDRPLWHAADDNRSALTRRVLFLSYTYRWVRPREDVLAGHPLLARRLSLLRRQLLGNASGPTGHWQPADEDVPLRDWMDARGLRRRDEPAHR